MAAPPDAGREEAQTAARLLVALPERLRRPVAWMVHRPAGRILFGTASGLARV